MQASAFVLSDAFAIPDMESAVRQVSLPILLPDYAGHDIAAQYSTTRIGGDFLDVISSGDRLLFMLTDIAGERHDTQHLAAEVQEAFRSRGAAMLRTADANDADAVVMTLRDINQALMSAAGGVRCAPTFLAVYEVATGVLTYINAGAAPAILRDSKTTLLDSNGLPLGLFTHLTHDAGFTVLGPGASLTLISKGLMEARRGREEFGMERVVRIVEQHHDSAAALNRDLLDQAQSFRSRKAGFFGPSLSIPGFHPGEDEQDMTAFTLIRAA